MGSEMCIRDSHDSALATRSDQYACQCTQRYTEGSASTSGIIRATRHLISLVGRGFGALQADLSQLHDGDTIELASDRFPTLSLIDPNSDDRIKLDQLATITGMALPKNAELYRYKSYGLDGILTFQHGRLVKDNHDKHPVVVAQQRLIPTPNLWIRAGILPFYVLFASVLRAAWIVVRRPGKTPNSDAMLAR